MRRSHYPSGVSREQVEQIGPLLGIAYAKNQAKDSRPVRGLVYCALFDLLLTDLLPQK